VEYEVQLAPIDKAIVTPNGFLEPLCNTCSAPDCTNPIRDKMVAIAGVAKKHRLYMVNGNIIRQVANCKGYVGNAILPSMGN
jgi:hypothetical protein